MRDRAPGSAQPLQHKGTAEKLSPCLGTPLGFLGFYIPHPYKSEQSLPSESVEF